MTRYCPDATFTEDNRTLFVFASYNSGPGRVSKLLDESEKLGFILMYGTTMWKS